MKLKTQHIPVDAGVPVCFLHREEAEELQLKHSDRVSIKKGNKEVTAIVDISNTHHFVKKGSIGLSDTISSLLKTKQRDILQVLPAEKPFSLEYLQKKIYGQQLQDSEMYALLADIVAGKYSQSEIALFIASCEMREMSEQEILALSAALLHTGENIKFDQYPVVDVRADSFSSLPFIIAPILTAAGLFTPVMLSDDDSASSQAQILNVFTSNEMNDGITSSGFLLESSLGIVPARAIFSTIEQPLDMYPVSHRVAELIARTRAIGSSHLAVLYGKQEATPALKKLFQRICKRSGVRALYTYADRAFIGQAYGPLLSARDILRVLELHPDASSTLKEQAILFAGSIFELLGKRNGLRMAREILESGHAYDVFCTMIGKRIQSEELEPQGYRADIRARNSGVIALLPFKHLERVAKICGAPYDPNAGIWFHRVLHDRVSEGEKILTLYATNKERLEKAKEFYRVHDDIVIA
jgi:thymidine phosphorylase